MARQVRIFTSAEAVRESVPLIIGLIGPSGSGKTYSALRLATGIQSVCGGEIFYIDTEAKRALHYADAFKFTHVDFRPPHGSLDYKDAIEYAVSKGAKTIVVDSMTHEHTGIGGHLARYEEELQRMGGDDFAKRERNKFTAFIKPKAERQQMIDRILQLPINIIFCFRAKEKLKLTRNAQGKMEPVQMGYSPVGSEELVFELTASLLLLPGARGVPTWRSHNAGESDAIKVPAQFSTVFDEREPISEAHGAAMARWATGGATPSAPPPTARPLPERLELALVAIAPYMSAAEAKAEVGLDEGGEVTEDHIARLRSLFTSLRARKAAEAAAGEG